ncbi:MULTISPECIES: thiol-disulfide oxidoreductase DCC family protein [Priestia]|uniref:thiol-disulfide oxidoreductase DCC family protein n=1 Tax=Priestia TaxID=2800373 RepID=UPI001C8EAB9E|nr:MULTISPECIES: thiol-disulfide oxidoreductase DCC family protein [Priestia]MBX9986673.1 thiol-disulfide oxidoreductase DCC family protein [Priestia aryabhattai]MBX9999443.1 thiol-disulfide oxidoreductase DCC family protein [Priestia aryabhattai]MDG0059497.1 thiol-disulfide oxidoreductase DCC family protein [Priestia sp. P5]UYV55308.1 thiol-disulfide oxidoreductase DCC family protein [Priestia megaterium]
MPPNLSHHPIILFDGVCNLCNQWVQFVIKRDRRALFRFASLQSDTAGILLRKHNYEDPPLQSVILLMNGNLYTESTAILHIVRHLRGPIKLMACLQVVPAFIRNPFYRFIARNRYKWFGKQTSCMLPTPETKIRFLD